mmetsp:Transcript_22776/g.50828  ORF Transcript_22776/g.50828 Transcript_22776/m.50828 type:complete len:490 (+) Transcript_22776:2225-3694(+)|eukprot:CAMPEP_0201118876 /NCGR_PEP_ID=MMETSP0850-20130426/3070_1 /ASSEMBLY_ACC=CAM_ASM_000622 /TAXON_ID=183588 /ORGANISM="Pseudo-nitzschia fraudulenta, Strain WWA7" /LENGTH=489 /DNA_ID=CAMNT_0047384349 /DNA_START=473 /DNA_END=1942 /DNA_ORIENTATION=+
MQKTIIFAIGVASLISLVCVEAFSTLPSLSSSSQILRHRSIPSFSTANECVVDATDPSPAVVLEADQSTIRQQQLFPEAMQRLRSTVRLSMMLLFSVPAMAPGLLAEPAFAAAPTLESSVSGAKYDVEGVSAVTQSSLGTSVRSTVVQSAKLVDAVDMKWERFSDSLRDNKKCDPRTNRRLFDNGFRSDGTPRGNPVLGALCEPVPLKEVDEGLISRVLGGAFDDAAYETLGADKAVLAQLVDRTRGKLEPAFARAIEAKAETEGKKAGAASSAPVDEVRKQQRYNLEVYSRVRAYGEALVTTASSAPTTQGSSTKPPSKASIIRQSGRNLDLQWGRNLLDRLAGPANAKYEFQSPFPKPDADTSFPYEVEQLTNALGSIEKALGVLQDGGLIGHWEISIPEDDYGEVVTIAVDDDVCLGAQILAREENPASPLTGSPVVAMVRSAMEDRAKIPYAALDVFFIDPTTTKNELYNPTQLLVSLRNLGEEP